MATLLGVSSVVGMDAPRNGRRSAQHVGEVVLHVRRAQSFSVEEENAPLGSGQPVGGREGGRDKESEWPLPRWKLSMRWRSRRERLRGTAMQCEEVPLG